MLFKVFNQFSGKVIFEREAESLRIAVEAEIGSGADLREADLQRADLQGADLPGADLQRANLREANLQWADLREADLQGVNLQRANLQWANLREANLQRADLQRANLQWADLQWADLQGADLPGADLRGAHGITAERTDALRILLEQPNPIRAYKLVNAAGEGPFNGGINYLSASEFDAGDLDTNESVYCGAGINLATLPWCLNEWHEGYRILIMEFDVSDDDPLIIPHGTDGKFRVRRCRRVGEVTQERIDAALGRTSPANPNAK